jgi:PAS domain-containing protein
MRDRLNHWLAAMLCALAGVSIAALPHFLAWAKTGRLDFVSTVDERYYLAVGSQVYFNHPAELADPVRAGPAPSVYRGLPFLPGVWAAKLFDLGPLGISLMWRILAGAMIGLAWYLLFRQRFAHRWVAASLSAILLSDPGLCQGVPFARDVSRLMQLARAASDSLFPGGHWMHLEWRVVSPATTMAYLIFLIWSVQRARATPTPRRIALAGLAYGLLFYVFFYYWTAVGLALLLALALDTGQRRIYLHTGWIGALLGLPAVYSDFLLKQRLAPDWFLRCDRLLPIGRFTELELPKEMLVVTVLGLAWVLFRRRDLIFVWSLGAAGLMLANHQIVTGLQIENYHWMYVWGPAFSFLLIAVAADEFGNRLNWSPAACAAVIAASLAAFGAGLWIRVVEATRCTDPVHNARVIAAYRAEFLAGQPPGFVTNSVAAGDMDFIDFASILDNLRPLSGWSAYLSPSVSDVELDERVALNELLRGVDRATFESRQRAFFESFPMGPCQRDPSLRPLRVAARLAAYDRIRADINAAVARFAVQYVALPAGNRPAYLAEGWAPMITGPTWDVWERTSSLAVCPVQDATRQ